MTCFSDYIKEIRKNLERGDSTEHTHRSALKRLLEECGKDIVATNEPRRIACGAPDFNITRNGVPLGHIETKDVGTNLDEMERGKGPNGEQFLRYCEALPNWILTDYMQFRWFVKGEKRLTVDLAKIDPKGKLRLLFDGETKLEELLTCFFNQEALTVGTAKELAERMAAITRIIRGLIVKTFEQEQEKGWLHSWLAAFQETLIPELDESQFADMFAQTISYGLFAACVHTPANKEFSREMAAFNLPKTNPFLRKLFAQIAGIDMPDTVDWAVNDLVELLKHANMREVLKYFGKGRGKEDPVFHFYETFLASYDPNLRRVCGVYFTPEPVVGYIVRSIDDLLVTRFNRPKGLADENTLILDPATGTATFLYYVIDQIHERFAKQAAAWNGYVEEHLLNRVFGFELLMAPYAVAHLKLGMQLQETGYKFSSDQRLGIYLTNTLEEATKRSEQLFAGWVAEEANAAAKIKSELPIMVVLGNPPYSQKRERAKSKDSPVMERYRQDVRAERRSGPLSNDYVRFLAFAHERIEKTGYGIVAMITSNSYLDGLVHKGMRRAFLESFDEVFVLNLHGNSLPGRRHPAEEGGGKINVFDIQEGVAITILVKTPRRTGKCIVNYSGILGTRETKYRLLRASSVASTEWNCLQPGDTQQSLFVPFSGKQQLSGRPLNDLFPVSSVGITTFRDHYAIAFTRGELESRLQDTMAMRADIEAVRTRFNLQDGRGLDLRQFLKTLNKDVFGQIHPMLVQPFDTRCVVYRNDLIGAAREAVQRHLLHSNISLLATRRTKEPFGVFCTRALSSHKVIAKYEGTYAYPLYLYPNGEFPDSLFEHEDGRRPNLCSAFVREVSEKFNMTFVADGTGDLKETFGPEDLFHYMYCVFYSSSYRTSCAEFLKIDFPRLPLTPDVKLFCSLVSKGAELVSLHLLESPRLDQFLTEWSIKGSNVVERAQHVDNDNKVWINKTQYFSGVPKPIWELQIGGYQVCYKWLKDRMGRKLTYDDTQHYQKVIVALNETIQLMREIDEIIARHGGWPNAFKG